MAALQGLCIFIQIFTVSHAKERTQKNCLNCNAEVMGRYCQVCGQENIETHETFWQLTTHLVYDIVHFDGKFFSTLKKLLFKPGFLTKEYIRGKRASYLHPIRMYVFTSTIFFIIFFTFILPKDALHDSGQPANENISVDSAQLKTENPAQNSTDSKKLQVRDSILKALADQGIKVNDASSPLKISVDTAEKKGNIINFRGEELPKSIEAYQSMQKKLPQDKQDGWLVKMVTERSILISNKYNGDVKRFGTEILENFFHSLPKMMFISLPLAALILQLLYIKRKQFLYVHHGVFLIHGYIAVYILFLLQYGLGAINDILHWSLISYLLGFSTFLIFFYLYKSMRNFYGQGRAKTLFKFFLFNMLYFLVLALLAAVFFTTSIFQI